MENKSKNKSDYLVQGTILVVASFVARVIGMVYRIPLTNILGDTGTGYYSTANEIYSIILMISSFSMPLAVSKLVSERLSAGEKKNAYRVFLCSMRFSAILGAVMALATFLLAGVITKYLMSVEYASYALRVLAPAIFIFAIVGVFRGFFQGHGTMVPTAVSQVIEQIVNAVVSVVCAALFMSIGASHGDELLASAYGAAGGTSGTVVSVAVALAFLAFLFAAYRKTLKRQLRRDYTRRREADIDIYKAIILTIIPVVLSTLVYNIGTIIDQGIFNAVMKAQGMQEGQYTAIYGIYSGKYRVLMNVPLSIASCLAPSVVPSLTAAMTKKNTREASSKVRNTIRYTMILTIPCAVGLASLASPIMRLVFGDSSSLAAGLMQSGALLIVLLALSTLTTGILQGLGLMKEPLIHSGIALVVHLIVLYVMLQLLGLNIYSLIYSNIVFAFIICMLNAFAIHRFLHYRQEILKTFLIPLISSGIMGLVVFGVYQLFNLFAGNAISTVIGILVGAAVYLVLLIKLRGVTETEILGIPKGSFFVRILKKCRLL